MKEKFVKLTKPLLVACMGISFLVSYDLASILFFGEYKYPQNPSTK